MLGQADGVDKRVCDSNEILQDSDIKSTETTPDTIPTDERGLVCGARWRSGCVG